MQINLANLNLTEITSRLIKFNVIKITKGNSLVETIIFSILRIVFIFNVMNKGGLKLICWKRYGKKCEVKKVVALFNRIFLVVNKVIVWIEGALIVIINWYLFKYIVNKPQLFRSHVWNVSLVYSKYWFRRPDLLLSTLKRRCLFMIIPNAY